MRPLRARIDLGALRANLRAVRRAVPKARLLAVVKANAYGHGLAAVGRALAGVDGLAVACLEEALVLREAGVRAPILLLEGFFDDDEVAPAERHRLSCVVHDPHQIEILERRASFPALDVWIKVDTGMNRLGFPPEAVPVVLERLAARGAFARHPPVLMTHFAQADRPGEEATRDQIRRFEALARPPGALRSAANSAALLACPEAHYDWVRPGLLLFGVSPFPDRDGSSLGFRPVMSLITETIALRRVALGDRVGYGGAWRAERPGWIAIAAVGYGDGYPWRVPDGNPVRVGSRLCPLAGRVSMDMIAIDLGADPVPVGTPVELWGSGLPVEDLARRAGTVPYELLCGIASRVRYEIVGEEPSGVEGPPDADTANETLPCPEAL
jgi:alanine racemase